MTRTMAQRAIAETRAIQHLPVMERRGLIDRFDAGSNGISLYGSSFMLNAMSEVSGVGASLRLELTGGKQRLQVI